MPRSAKPYGRIAILGMGSWGTALASVAATTGCSVRLWGRKAKLAEAINSQRVNVDYLPDAPLPEGIEATSDLAHALEGAEAVLLVTPSRTLRKLCAQIRPHLPPRVPVVLCCKGIEQGTGYLLSYIVEEELPGHPVGALSGPTFAKETVLGHPSAATIAFEFSYKDRLTPQESPAARLAVTMSSAAFRPYISDVVPNGPFVVEGDDPVSVDVTVTNTFPAGELTLTCSSLTSRNMSLGHQLGQGIPRAECFDGKKVVVEGEVNAISVVDLARRIGVTMPICEAVHAILHEGADLSSTFVALWSRPIESEPRALSIKLDHPASLKERS